ncbi:retrovirus-related pol polyprotein from transposon TNT 1-94, partial [Tanacetum coccineum]
NPPYEFQWAERSIPVAKGSSETTTEGCMENYKNVSQDIRNQIDAEDEAIQIILTWIDNDIHSIVDACPNACEMWKVIERLKQGESINVQDLETNLYWKFGKFTSKDGETLESYYSRFYKMMNELVKNQCNVTNHQVNVQFLLQLQPEWQRFVTLVKQSQELKTVSYHKFYDILKQHQNKVNEIRAEILARTANPHKIYKPTNNNLKTSSNTSIANNDNTLRINRGTGYNNQRVVNVVGARENVGTQVVQQSGIKCYNCKKYGHVAREYQKLKWEKDAAYHKEKMLLYQEFEAHYLYMAQIQGVTPDVANNFGPIFDAEPLQKVQNDDDNYNVFAKGREHLKQPKSINDTYLDEQDDTNITTDSLDMSNNGGEADQDDDDYLARERYLLASLIEKLKCEIDESKDRNKLLESS